MITGEEQFGWRSVADHYGYDHQRLKACEELSELQKELLKGINIANIAEEIADVEAMLFQLKYLLGIDTDRIRKQKLNRTIDRMKK